MGHTVHSIKIYKKYDVFHTITVAVILNLWEVILINQLTFNYFMQGPHIIYLYYTFCIPFYYTLNIHLLYLTIYLYFYFLVLLMIRHLSIYLWWQYIVTEAHLLTNWIVNFSDYFSYLSSKSNYILILYDVMLQNNNDLNGILKAVIQFILWCPQGP